MPQIFNAKIWSFDWLEYLRMRTRAVIDGTDPDEVPEPLESTI